MLILCSNFRIICNHHKHGCRVTFVLDDNRTYRDEDDDEGEKKSFASITPCSSTPFDISNDFNGVLQIIIISLTSILCAIPKDLFSAIISIFLTFLSLFFSFSPHSKGKTTSRGWCYLNRYLHKAKQRKWKKKNKRANTRNTMNGREKKRFVSAICRSPSFHLFAPKLQASLLMGESRK